MPLPVTISTATVVGSAIFGADGTPATGRVIFASPALQDVAGNVILGALEWSATVTAGAFSIVLPLTDTAGITPLEWTYGVTINVTGNVTAGSMSLPTAGGATQQFAGLFIPGEAVASGTTPYASQAYVQAGDAATLESAEGYTDAEVTTLALATATALTGKVDTTRQVTTTAPLTGGGALSGNLTLGVSVGSSTGTVAAGNDSRLSDARTPTAHAVTHAEGGADPVTLAQSQITGLAVALTALNDAVIARAARASNLSDLADAPTARTNLGLAGAALLNVGTVAGTVAAGDDSRLSNARTPTAHATSHAEGNGDPVTLAQTQITGLVAALAAKLTAANNLSDLTVPATARTNLGLAGAAVLNVGITSGTVAEGRAPWFANSPIPISGRYVYTGYGATSTVVPTLSQTRYTPFAVWDGFTATSIAVEVTTLQATSVVRLGLWADDGAGLPGALITDFGTVSAAGAGVVSISPGGGIALADRTLYWLSATVQVAGGTAALRAANYHDPLILPSTNGVTNSGINAYAQAGVTGALAGPAVPADGALAPRFMLLIA
jgi:hypothetical protein